MDIIRRNTDYAVRLMVRLARDSDGQAVSTRVLAGEEGVPYQLACKLMQALHAARLVESRMGPKGGFHVARLGTDITILEVIRAIQGPIRLNRCLLSDTVCPRQKACPVRAKMGELQEQMERYLGGVTLQELAQDAHAAGKGKRSQRRRA